MKMWALCALLLPSIAGAAEVRVLDHVLSHRSVAPVAELLIPRSELALKPGRIENYGGITPFFANPRYDHVFVDLPRDAALERVAAAAAVIAAGKSPKKTIARIQRHLDRGEEIPLREFMPTFAKLWTGKHADCEGPNCFNAALLFDGLADGPPRYMDDWELENVIDDRFRPLQPGERLRVGDLIAFHTVDRHEREGISHAARYVGDDFIWHKASRKPETPFTFEKLTHAADSYVRMIGNKWLDLTLRAYRRK